MLPGAEQLCVSQWSTQDLDSLDFALCMLPNAENPCFLCVSIGVLENSIASGPRIVNYVPTNACSLVQCFQMESLASWKLEFPV